MSFFNMLGKLGSGVLHGFDDNDYHHASQRAPEQQSGGNYMAADTPQQYTFTPGGEGDPTSPDFQPGTPSIAGPDSHPDDPEVHGLSSPFADAIGGLRKLAMSWHGQ